jgi:putative DNA primase/helicase
VTYDEVVARFPGARQIGEGKVAAHCPAHEDSTASLSISRGTDGRTVMHCHAGCATADILATVGMTERDLFADERPAPKTSGARTYYDYLDKSGKLLYQAVRIPTADGKTFRQRRPDGKGGWLWNLQGTPRVLYRLPELLAASPDRIVYVVEGEKDADNLRALGEFATTNPQGAGKWRPEYAEPLRGRHVVILPDNDEPGRKHGEDVARSLRGVAASVKVVVLPGLPPKGDVSDWLAAGHAVDELHALVTGAPEQATISEEPAQAEVVTADSDYRFSESEAARRFGDILRGRAVFAADEGQWYYFDGARWVKDHSGVWLLEQSLAVSRAYAEDGIRAGSNDPQFQARMGMAKSYNGLPGRKRLIELVKAEPGLAILSSQFDADPWLFNVLNGTVNLQTGQLQPHSAADLITKLARVEYDPEATRERWDPFIDEVIPNAEARAHFKRVVGYFLTGVVYEHKLFFCYGTGANGKSVVLEVLLALLGDHGTLAPVSLLMAKPTEQHPCDRIVLRGRRLAVFAETPAGQRWDESTVKALTGGDTITARGMRENFSTFAPTAKFAIAGNHRPRVNDLTEGFWRRFEEIPFEVTIPEDHRDPKLADKLRAELPGILLWALEGCAAWQREGLGKSVKVQTATGAYRAESDRLAPFLAERCALAPGNRVSRAALRGAYEGWCSGEGEHPINPRDFAEQLRHRDVAEAKLYEAGKSVRGWRGIGLVHMDTSGQQFPVNPLEESSQETNRKSVSSCVPCVPDAPDPLAQLAHCLRARTGTTASDEDRQALAEHFRGLNGKSEATGQRLWSYWKAAPSPTVGDFLAAETRRRPAP